MDIKSPRLVKNPKCLVDYSDLSASNFDSLLQPEEILSKIVFCL